MWLLTVLMMILLMVCLHAMYRHVCHTMVPPNVVDLASLHAKTDDLVATFQSTLAHQWLAAHHLPSSTPSPLSSSSPPLRDDTTPLASLMDKDASWTKPSYDVYPHMGEIQQP